MTVIATASGLDFAFAASLRGTQDAADRFARAAGRIAAAGTETPRAPDPIGGVAGGPALIAAREAPDLATGMIQARMAQRAYEANLAVMRRVDAMAGEALRLLR